jgi:hypothetical protein
MPQSGIQEIDEKTDNDGRKSPEGIQNADYQPSEGKLFETEQSVQREAE